MKFKEYFSLYMNLLKSKSLVILRCPYCDSFDITYYKSSLTEDDTIDDSKVIKYYISCNKCKGVAAIQERWKINRGD